MQCVLVVSVLGCPDMVAPPGTWMDRHEDQVTIVCNQTQQVWQLKCQGNSWVGLLGNCSNRGKLPTHDSIFQGNPAMLSLKRKVYCEEKEKEKTGGMLPFHECFFLYRSFTSLLKGCVVEKVAFR